MIQQMRKEITFSPAARRKPARL